MNTLGPAFAFYAKHVNDILSLRALKSPPNGVNQETWTKFQLLAQYADIERDALFAQVRAAMVTGLGDSVDRTGEFGLDQYPPPEHCWDAWQELILKGQRERIGYFGSILCMIDEIRVGFVGYVKLEKGLISGLPAKKLMPSLRKFIDEQSIVVWQEEFSPDSEISTLLADCRWAFTEVQSALNSTNPRTVP